MTCLTTHGDRRLVCKFLNQIWGRSCLQNARVYRRKQIFVLSSMSSSSGEKQIDAIIGLPGYDVEFPSRIYILLYLLSKFHAYFLKSQRYGYLQGYCAKIY